MSQDPLSRPWFGFYTLRSRELPPYPTLATEVDERVYLRVPRFRQQRSLSCELAALRMAAHYQIVIRSETQLVRILPKDTSQPRYVRKKLIWGDPNKVFPGNIRGWQLYAGGIRRHPRRARIRGWGYGVYGPVIAEVATKIGLRAEVFDQVDDVYTALDRGYVPIVIVPCSGRSTTRRWHWYSPRGDRIPVINAEHAIVVVGYNERRVWVNDPLGKVSRYQRIVFERAFRLLTSGVAVGPPRTVVPAPSERKPFGLSPQRWPFQR